MKSRSRTQSKSNLDISGINLSDMEGFENTSAFTCGDDMEVLLADASQDLNFSEFAIPMRRGRRRRFRWQNYPGG